MRERGKEGKRERQEERGRGRRAREDTGVKSGKGSVARDRETKIDSETNTRCIFPNWSQQGLKNTRF